MPKVEQMPTIQSECLIRLTEAEMRGLAFLKTYGTDSVMKMVDKNYTEADVKKYGPGVRSFFAGIGEIDVILKRTDDAREVFNGRKLATVKPRPGADAS